jgi:nucleotide-binding universal stress UspA family protein
MKLLLAIDSSEASQLVVDEVVKRPWPKGTSACILHVLYLPALPIRQTEIDALKRSAESLVKSGCEKLSAAGIPVTAQVLEGVPQVVIPTHAKESHADLLLLGAHGTTGLTRFLLGSVAKAAMRWAPCSVEIVRHGSQVPSPRQMKILLATDGSEYATAAARSIAARPWPAGSEVRAISVAPIIAPLPEAIPLSPSYYPSPEIVEIAQQETHRRAEEALARARQALSVSAVRLVESECSPVGDARGAILDEAENWGADLIVLGSLGHHGIKRFMLGSVSESVAMHALCSVEVVR